MALMLSSNIPVELPLLFEEGYSHFRNSPTARAALASTKQGARKVRFNEKHNNAKEHLGKCFADYRNYLDQFKARNTKYSSINTHMMRGIATRVKRYYDRYKVIPQAVFDIWATTNMPYVILSTQVIRTEKRKIIKLHKTEVTRERITYYLSKGDIVRMSELPDDLDLSGFEIYGDGTVENEYILGDVSLMTSAIRTDLLSNTFAKRDASEYSEAGDKLSWLSELEKLVAGDTILTATLRRDQPMESGKSIWYNVTARVVSTSLKCSCDYKGVLLSPKPFELDKMPLTVSKTDIFSFINNFITSESKLISLQGNIHDLEITILTAELSSAGIKGTVAYGVTAIELLPGDVYYLIGRKGSGKSTKMKVLSQIANVEDSDDYGIFLTKLLKKFGMLNVPFEELLDWTPTMTQVKNQLDLFLQQERDYENEQSYFFILAKIIVESPLPDERKTRRLITYINNVMAHQYIGTTRYAQLRELYHDKKKPTFIMCHSTAETCFRETPKSTIVLGETIDAREIIAARKRGSSPRDDRAEMLLYCAYAEGISTTNKCLPFAIILEHIRCLRSDVNYGALALAT